MPNYSEREILAQLDAYAREFNFPAIDNAHLFMPEMRLTAFRSDTLWLVVFEEIAYFQPDGSFVDFLCAYGNTIAKVGLQHDYELLVTETASDRLWHEETNVWILEIRPFEVLIRDRPRRFSPTRDDLVRRGILPSDRKTWFGEFYNVLPEPGWGPVEFLAYICDMLPMELLCDTDSELLRKVGLQAPPPKLLQTSEWQHPHITADEMPSQNVTMRSLATALVTGNPGDFNPGSPNTTWRTHWLPASGIGGPHL